MRIAEKPDARKERGAEQPGDPQRAEPPELDLPGLGVVELATGDGRRLVTVEGGAIRLRLDAVGETLDDDGGPL